MPLDESTVGDSARGPLTTGTLIGSHRIEGPIGSGGMGAVYRALDTRLNRPVAIKVLSNELADADARRRFHREAQMASSLNHPHILTVYDVGELEGRQYLVPEYVDGGKVDQAAAKALICFWTSPEWSLKMAYAGSNPGNLNGFKTKWMKERLENSKFLDVTTSMLPYGIPFPTIPETPEIMNIVVPDMLQNALTGSMTVDQAAEDAAKKVKNIMSGGKL